MATKKKVSRTPKAKAKKTKKTSKKKKDIMKGDKYVCDVCGLVVSVDEIYGGVKVCDIICCGRKMKPKIIL